MKTRFAMPGLVILFSTAAIALMSVSVRTSRADDTQLQTGTTGQAQAAVDQAVAKPASTATDAPVPKPTTPVGVQSNRYTPTPTPAAGDTEKQSGCCG